jgi:hypothetical protein
VLLKKRFSGPVVFYGPHVSVEPDNILASPAVDAVVMGEAPPLFLEIARRRGFGRVPGIWHKRAGRVMKNRPSSFISDLDSLPIPPWHLVDYKRYSYVTTQTSWGCPFRCGYCPYPVTQGERWRVRSTASVVKEFLALRERYGLRFVLLRDPEFLERVRASAGSAIDRLVRRPSPAAFLRESERFTDALELGSPRLRRTIVALRRTGVACAQAMLGEALFAVPNSPMARSDALRVLERRRLPAVELWTASGGARRLL